MTSLASATNTSLSSIPLRTLYTRLLLTRLVDAHLQALSEQGYIDAYASCQGHEAAQVGSAICIEVGQDFTLPYYRDLGVVLTLGMTPYEVIHTCLCTYETKEDVLHTSHTSDVMPSQEKQKQPLQWSYHKHNMVHGNAPSATHILHAAGIAFASKLRHVPAVTIAYCGDGATKEPDFLEGIRFAAQQQLPVVFICEQECLSASDSSTSSCFQSLPEGLIHQRIDGTNVALVYQTMHTIVNRVRSGYGPVLLELSVTRSPSQPESDPLIQCEQMLREQQLWDGVWATKLHAHLSSEVEQAAQNALLDVLHSNT